MRNLGIHTLAITASFLLAGATAVFAGDCADPRTGKACASQTGKTTYTYGKQIFNIQFQNTCGVKVGLEVKLRDDSGRISTDNLDLKPGEKKWVECNWPGKVAMYCIVSAVSVCESESGQDGSAGSGSKTGGADQSSDDEEYEDADAPSSNSPVASISPDVSEGILNMRDGPGQGHGLVTSIPAGSGGVRVGGCVQPDDGRSRYQWCLVEWNGKRGWVSKGGLIAGGAPSRDEDDEEEGSSEASAEPRVGPCLCNNQTNAMRCASQLLKGEQCVNRRINGMLVEVCSPYKLSIVANAHPCSPYR